MRWIMLMALAIALPMRAAMAIDLDPADWQLYRAQYIQPEGRVVDAVNGGITTTEGQGYAMLLATAYDDRATFDSLWKWTTMHLRHPDTQSFAWKWIPGKSKAAEAVPDANNASDGDMLIAWALIRAARQWHADDYKTAALAIEATLRTHLIRTSDGLSVLLPGTKGFADDKKLVVNLSYWIFPAMDELGKLSGQSVWKQLSDDGLKLIDQFAFGRWGLPPDWLALKPKPSVAEGLTPWFGYNAIRIPLHLIWGGKATPARMNRYLAFWDMFTPLSFTPAWTDLTNDGVDSHDASPGFKAIMALTRAQAAGRKLSPADLPALTRDQSYFSASLLLLSKLAAKEAP